MALWQVETCRRSQRAQCTYLGVVESASRVLAREKVESAGPLPGGARVLASAVVASW